jgi:hypothetical protein
MTESTGNMDEATPDPQLRDEIARLHSEIARLNLAVSRPRYGWLGFVIKDLETNPHTQYKVHLYGVVYWLINFPMIIALFFLLPALWLKLGIFITLMYSIYANFATDYGAMSAAMAAFGQDPPREIPLEPIQPGKD